MDENNEVKEPNFPLNKAQKIEFSKIALNKIKGLYPHFIPDDVELGSTSYGSVTYVSDSRDFFMLGFYFDQDNAAYCCCKNLTKDSCNDIVRPLYFDYMYKRFGEPFRETALAFWQKKTSAVYDDYRELEAKKITDLKKDVKLEDYDVILDSLNNLGRFKEFQLTEEQGIEFCQQAIKKIRELLPQAPADINLYSKSDTRFIFKNSDVTLYTLGSFSLEFHLSTFKLKFSADMREDLRQAWKQEEFSESLQTLYTDYMCETFGEPYRKAALIDWQEQSVKQDNEYQAQVAELEQKRAAQLAKRKAIFDFLSKNTDKKLSHFAAPDMQLKDATKEQDPSREK